MKGSLTIRPLFSWIWPKKLASQLILLLLLAILAAQAIALVIFHDQRRIALVALARDSTLSRAASIAELLDETPPELQTKILEANSTRFVAFWVGNTALAPAPGETRFEKRLQEIVRQKLEPGAQVHVNIHADERRGPSSRDPGSRQRENWRDIPRAERPARLKRIMDRPEDLSLSVGLDSGKWLNMATSYRPPTEAFAPLLVQLFLMALAIVGIVAFAVRRVTRPLNEVAEAAEKLGRGEDVPPIAAAGPQEVQALTGAFNDMQSRLTRFVRDRTRMLAAISHDLRTPITSLRLRAEFIDDEENREKMIATLDDMSAMTEAALQFAKDDAREEEAKKTNLGALLQSLADDQEDMGHQCKADVQEDIILSCRPVSLKRALRNLIENGNRYGGKVEITVQRHHNEAVITIRDHGPGIPEDRLNDVFEPFVRLEESRSEETGGIGLGLAITRSIIHAHGGTTKLRNHPNGGLEAKVSLPISK